MHLAQLVDAIESSVRAALAAVLGAPPDPLATAVLVTLLGLALVGPALVVAPHLVPQLVVSLLRWLAAA